MDVITIKNVVPDNIGIVTYLTFWKIFAPSISAASYKSAGTFTNPDKNKITVKTVKIFE